MRPPFDPRFICAYKFKVERFEEIFSAYHDGIEGKIRIIPSPKELPPLRKNQARLTDHPVNQGALAAKRICHDSSEFAAFLARIMAFHLAWDDGWFDRKLRPMNGGGVEMHSSVIKACAVAPLDSTALRFDHQALEAVIVARECDEKLSNPPTGQDQPAGDSDE